jgi:SAM-dependent methyltransferase
MLESVGLEPHEDAYGQAMLDHLAGRGGWEIVERDDGFFSLGAGPQLYLSPFRRWPSAERRAMRLVRGRVLDVGCGAGRALLHLRARGLDVTGIDISPGAVQACRQRGLTDVRVLGIEEIDPTLGRFDTVLMLGGGFGLLGTPERARTALTLLRRELTTDRGRILAASRDAEAGGDPDRVAAAQRNRASGHLSGQARIRIRYRYCATPWFEYFRCSPQEMARVVNGTGWTLARVIAGELGAPYIGVLERA